MTPIEEFEKTIADEVRVDLKRADKEREYLKSEVQRLKLKCNKAMERANLCGGSLGHQAFYSHEDFESET